MTHIYGHQDETTPYLNLPLPAQLNVDCDREAKAATRSSPPAPLAEPIAGASAHLILANDLVTTKMNEQIQLASQRKEMTDYTCKKLKRSIHDYNRVNLRAIGTAKSCLTRTRSIRTSKMMFSRLDVPRRKAIVVKYGTCPCCGTSMEDQLHLYRCQNPRMSQA